MGRIMSSFIMPHPPIMVREVGKGESEKVNNSVRAAMEVGRRIQDLKPDTVILITPHGTLLRDAISIAADDILDGSLARFGAPQVSMSLENDAELTDKLLEVADSKGITCIPMHEEVKPTYGFEPGLDHGAVVPLHFIRMAYQDFKLVHITYSLLEREQHYQFGRVIREAVEAFDRNAVVIASGDLSHRLSRDSYSGYSSRGAEFDNMFVDLVGKGQGEAILSIPDRLLEEAGECAYLSTVVLLGCLDGCRIAGEVLSYEGPFGVGYCVAELKGEVFMDGKRVEAVDPYVALAKATLEAYVETHKKIKAPDNLPEEMLKEKAGVFVSLKKFGELRGCIGTISPTTPSIAQEIIQNAVSAGTGDPRFYPVEAEELADLVYSVDVLKSPEPVASKDLLDVNRYGVIVRSGYRTGLLLPNLEGVDTVEEQLDIALRKAGIEPHERYAIERFEVIRHH